MTQPQTVPPAAEPPELHALTIHFPWAAAIALGHKSLETRSWRPQLTGPLLLAIHASNDRAADALERASRPELWDRIVPQNVRLPFGCIIGVCEVWDVIPTDGVPFRWGLLNKPALDLELQLGDYRDGRFAWPLRNLITLPKPVPVSGKQRLWRVAPAIAAEVMEQVRDKIAARRAAYEAAAKPPDERR